MGRRAGYLVLAVLVISVLLMASGCARGYSLALDRDGLVNEVIGYRIAERQTFQSDGGEWRIENFSNRGELKTADQFVTTVHLDVDDDGRTDTSKRLPLYDLLLENTRTGARIWARTQPIDNRLEHRELDGLMQDYIDAVAGAGTVMVQPLGSEVGVAMERRYATRTHDQGPIRIAGLDAYAATFSVYNVDQQRVSGSRPEEVVRMIVVRTNRRWPVSASLSAAPSRSNRAEIPTYPVLLILQASSRPEVFQATTEAFHDFVLGLRMLPDPETQEAPPRTDTTWPVPWRQPFVPSSPPTAAPPPAPAPPVYPPVPAPADPPVAPPPGSAPPAAPAPADPSVAPPPAESW